MCVTDNQNQPAISSIQNVRGDLLKFRTTELVRNELRAAKQLLNNEEYQGILNRLEQV